MGFTANVFGNQIGKLVEYAENYPYVFHILERYAPTINIAFGTTLPAIPGINKNGDKLYDPNKLKSAHESWKHFLPTHSSTSSDSSYKI